MKETADLFGNNVINVIPSKKKPAPKTLFYDYEGFVDKFEPKKTTDDCYTPPEIFNCVLHFLATKFDLNNKEVIRPFFPGGDYESVDYPSGCVVIDNPPFSILSKIARFYIERNIKFFLFAPHMTLFSANIDCTAIVCGADIIYENGAKVKTSFLSNMLGDYRVLSVPDLYKELMAINESKKVRLPKYKYPENVLTVSMVQKYVELGIPVEIDKGDVYHCASLDSQKKHKKGLFGGGFLLSEQATAEKLAAEKLAAEKDNTIIWELSDREKTIIKSLSQ